MVFVRTCEAKHCIFYRGIASSTLDYCQTPSVWFGIACWYRNVSGFDTFVMIAVCFTWWNFFSCSILDFIFCGFCEISYIVFARGLQRWFFNGIASYCGILLKHHIVLGVLFICTVGLSGQISSLHFSIFLHVLHLLWYNSMVAHVHLDKFNTELNFPLPNTFSLSPEQYFAPSQTLIES